MMKFEKATYGRLALNEGLKQIKAVHLTAARKDCYYPIYSDLKSANNWLEDYAGNRHAFYCYQLEEYKDRLYNHYKETTATEFAKLARRAKRAMIENIGLIFKDWENGSLDIV